MRSLALAVTLFVTAIGCHRSADAPTGAAASTSAAGTQASRGEARLELSAPRQGDPTQRTICPFLWTCDMGRFFSTKAACQAACGATACFREQACSSTTCVCP